jgi:hypothetical protein
MNNTILSLLAIIINNMSQLYYFNLYDIVPPYSLFLGVAVTAPSNRVIHCYLDGMKFKINFVLNKLIVC